MAPNDPTEIQRAVASLHTATRALVDRLDNLQANGMLGTPEASQGWRDRVRQALDHVKALGIDRVPVPPDSEG